MNKLLLILETSKKVFGTETEDFSLVLTGKIINSLKQTDIYKPNSEYKCVYNTFTKKIKVGDEQ